MSAEITLSGEDLMPILDLIEAMRDKGTFRSKAGFTTAEKMGMWLAGKGAEIAFSRFLDETWNVSTKTDTRAYDDVRADSGDIWQVRDDSGEWIDANPVEIKKTADYANHVAITQSEMRQVGPDEPIVYVTTNWLKDKTPPTRPRDWLLDQEVTFTVVGWCQPDDLHWVEQGAEPWTQLEKNKCQPFSQMNDDWRKFCTMLGEDVTAQHQRFVFSE